MSDLQKSMAGLIEKLQAEGKSAKNLAELEQVIIRYSQELSRTAYQELSKDLEARISPQEKRCPECQGRMYVAEKRLLGVVSLWGECQALRCRYRCRGCGSSLSSWLDRSLDESGCLPEVLMRAHELATLLPYRQTREVLRRWGVDLGKSLLCGLNEQLNQATEVQGSQKLSELAQEPLCSRPGSSKTWMIEVDGKFVPVWTQEQEKKLEWREVKTAVLYPMHTPSERYSVSHLGGHEVFAERVHGLLRHAGVSQEDRLIGLCDGALWIASLIPKGTSG
jgi:hypothetical protein